MLGGKWRRRRSLGWLPLVAAVALAAGACEEDDDPIGPGDGDPDVPRNVDADSTWLLHGWSGLQPVGHAAVQVTWELPQAWDGEAFRVYGRRASGGSYFLIGTVTSCGGDGICRYTDLNVEPGASYDYYVTAVDEGSGFESEPSDADRVAVPSGSAPSPPTAPRVVALDGALFLQWAATGAERFRVFLEREAGDSVFLEVGETDGTGYLDLRAENGVEYGYRVAAIDASGRFGARSILATGIPRPDFRAELIYAFADDADASGFRFVDGDSLSPIVPGNASNAQWRLEMIGGFPHLVPLGDTEVTSGVLTTELTCGPGSDPDCFAVHSADDPDAPDDFSAEPVELAPELTYLLRVRGDDGRTHYGKVRVTLDGVDQQGRDLVIFDWAYQLLPDEPSLHLGAR